jgi:hypothetical protein
LISLLSSTLPGATWAAGWKTLCLWLSKARFLKVSPSATSLPRKPWLAGLLGFYYGCLVA